MRFVITTRSGDAIGIQRVEALHAAKHPITHRIAFITKNYWAPSIDCAKVEKP